MDRKGRWQIAECLVLEQAGRNKDVSSRANRPGKDSLFPCHTFKVSQLFQMCRPHCRDNRHLRLYQVRQYRHLINLVDASLKDGSRVMGGIQLQETQGDADMVVEISLAAKPDAPKDTTQHLLDGCLAKAAGDANHVSGELLAPCACQVVQGLEDVVDHKLREGNGFICLGHDGRQGILPGSGFQKLMSVPVGPLAGKEGFPGSHVARVDAKGSQRRCRGPVGPAPAGKVCRVVWIYHRHH